VLAGGIVNAPAAHRDWESRTPAAAFEIDDLDGVIVERGRKESLARDIRRPNDPCARRHSAERYVQSGQCGGSRLLSEDDVYSRCCNQPSDQQSGEPK